MSVPKDQSLALTVFMSIGLFVVVLFWIFLPIQYNPYKEEGPRPFLELMEPPKAIPNVKGVLGEVEKAIAKIEEEKENEKGEEPENPKEAGKK